MSELEDIRALHRIEHVGKRGLSIVEIIVP
jgi:hypothetical protein